MKIKIIPIVGIVVIVLMGYNTVFSPTGLVTMYRLKVKTGKLAEQISAESKRKDLLVLAKQRMKTDLVFIERVAREELGYCYEDEMVLKIIPAESGE